MKLRLTMLSFLVAVALFVGLSVREARAEKPSIARVSITDLPVSATAAVMTNSLTPYTSSAAPNAGSLYRVSIAMVGTNSVVSIRVTKTGGTTYEHKLNGGTALTAGVLYTTSFVSATGCTYNVYNTTASTVGYLAIDEVVTAGGGP